MGTTDDRPAVGQHLLPFGSMIAMDDFDKVAETLAASTRLPKCQPASSSTPQLGQYELEADDVRAEQAAERASRDDEAALIVALHFYGKDFSKISNLLGKQVSDVSRSYQLFQGTSMYPAWKQTVPSAPEQLAAYQHKLMMKLAGDQKHLTPLMSGPNSGQVKAGAEAFMSGALHANELLDLLLATSGREAVTRAMTPIIGAACKPNQAAAQPSLANKLLKDRLAKASAEVSLGTLGMSPQRDDKPTPPKRPSRPPTPSRNQTSYEHGEFVKMCSNCGTSNTPLWRKEGGINMCNACGIYFKNHGYHRPVELIKAAQNSQRNSLQNSAPKGTPGHTPGHSSEVGDHHDTATSPAFGPVRRKSPLPKRTDLQQTSTADFEDGGDGAAHSDPGGGDAGARRSTRRRTTKQYGEDWYDTEEAVHHKLLAKRLRHDMSDMSDYGGRTPDGGPTPEASALHTSCGGGPNDLEVHGHSFSFGQHAHMERMAHEAGQQGDGEHHEGVSSYEPVNVAGSHPQGQWRPHGTSGDTSSVSDLTIDDDVSQVAAVLVSIKLSGDTWEYQVHDNEAQEYIKEEPGHWSSHEHWMPHKRRRSPAPRFRIPSTGGVSPANSTGAPGGPGPRSAPVALGLDGRPLVSCANCGTSKTPLWRKDKESGETMCNACGIYKQTHGFARPVELRPDSSRVLAPRSNRPPMPKPIKRPGLGHSPSNSSGGGRPPLPPPMRSNLGQSNGGAAAGVKRESMDVGQQATGPVAERWSVAGEGAEIEADAEVGEPANEPSLPSAQTYHRSSPVKKPGLKASPTSPGTEDMVMMVTPLSTEKPTTSSPTSAAAAAPPHHSVAAASMPGSQPPYPILLAMPQLQFQYMAHGGHPSWPGQAELQEWHSQAAAAAAAAQASASGTAPAAHQLPIAVTPHLGYEGAYPAGAPVAVSVRPGQVQQAMAAGLLAAVAGQQAAAAGFIRPVIPPGALMHGVIPPGYTALMPGYAAGHMDQISQLALQRTGSDPKMGMGAPLARLGPA